MGRNLCHLTIVVAMLLPVAATAESASDAMRAFGLIGTWSPDCAGGYLTSYMAPAGAAPTVRLTKQGREYASSEIREVLDRNGDRITWSSVIKTYSLPDQAMERWMPEPGEIWETVIEKLGDKIRPIESRSQDGQKVSVKGGFIYNGKIAGDGQSIAWHNTGQETLPLSRCEAKGALRIAPRRG